MADDAEVSGISCWKEAERGGIKDVSMHLEVRNARDMWAVVKAFTAAHRGYLTVSQASSAQCIATAAMTVSTSSMD